MKLGSYQVGNISYFTELRCADDPVCTDTLHCLLCNRGYLFAVPHPPGDYGTCTTRNGKFEYCQIFGASGGYVRCHDCSMRPSPTIHDRPIPCSKWREWRLCVNVWKMQKRMKKMMSQALMQFIDGIRDKSMERNQHAD